MKQVTINTSELGLYWIFWSLRSELKTKVASLGSSLPSGDQIKLNYIFEIAETMRVVCEARENAKKV